MSLTFQDAARAPVRWPRPSAGIPCGDWDGDHRGIRRAGRVRPASATAARGCPRNQCASCRSRTCRIHSLISRILRVLFRGRGVVRDDGPCYDRDCRPCVARSYIATSCSMTCCASRPWYTSLTPAMMTTARGARSHDVALEPAADLVAALAVHAVIQHLPLRVRLHQPVGVLARLVARAEAALRRATSTLASRRSSSRPERRW